MKIFELFGSIFIDSDQADKSMAKSEKNAKSFGKTLGGGIKTAAKWSAAFVGAAVAVGGAAIAAGNEFADFTDRIDKMSQKLNMSREGFQEWEFILSQSGTSMEAMKGGMKKLAMATDELKEGLGTGAAAFERLGIKLENIQGMTQEEIFETTIEALQGVADESERAAIANDLLGKSGQELAPLFNTSAEAVKNMKQQAHDLGLVLGDEAVDAGVKFTDTMDQFGRSFKGVTMMLIGGMMPALQGFMDFVMANMPAIQAIMGDVFGSIQFLVAALFPLIMNIVEGALPPLISLLTELFNMVLPIFMDIGRELIDILLPTMMELFEIFTSDILPPWMELFQFITNEILPVLVGFFMKIINELLPPLINLFTSMAQNVLPAVIHVFKEIIENVLPIIMELFKKFTEIILPPVIELFNVISEEVIPAVADIIMWFSENVLPFLMKTFERLVPVVEHVMKAVSAIIRTITAIIKGDWEGAWKGIEDFFRSTLNAIKAALLFFAKPFEGIFQKISDTVGGIWKGMVSGIKGGINYVIGAINNFIRGINAMEIPDWVPGVGGYGFHINEIPMLARGGNIVSSGRVLVGEAGPEFLDLPTGAKVTPLDKAMGTIFGPRAFEGLVLMDDYGVDRLMERIMERLADLGVS